ncbi:MAG: hypothetical protein IT355_19425 [Gemmatimonadaceae bacterium]|nr:hypothetical protein [Gemmatimonadaceae bacterium]
MRTRFADTDSMVFVMRRARGAHRTAYQSVAPLFLGRGAVRYVGWRQGCATVLSARGVPLVRATFRRLEQESGWSADTVMLRAYQEDSVGEGYRLLLAIRGRIVALSPRLYRRSYSQTLHAMTLLPPHLMLVASREEGGMGLVSRHTLREVLAPGFRGAGGLAQVVDGQLADQFLIADDGAQLQLFRTDGRRVVLPAFHAVETMSRWSQLRWPAKFIRVYATADTIRGTCRLYDGRLQPIVPEEIVTKREWGWRCQQLNRHINDAPVQFLAFSDPQGVTHTYRVSRRAIVKVGRGVAGDAVYVFPDGAMILRRTTPDGLRYLVTAVDGTPFPGAEFTDINLLGCGFVWVKRDGKWYTPGSDGSVSERLGYPFSC